MIDLKIGKVLIFTLLKSIHSAVLHLKLITSYGCLVARNTFAWGTDGRKNVCLSVRQKKNNFRTDRRTFFSSVCLSVKKKKKFRTDRRTEKCPSVCPSKKKKKIPDRQTDIFSSVCLSVKKKNSGQTDGRKKKKVLLRHGLVTARSCYVTRM